MKEGYAFADKSTAIKELEGKDMTNYPVLLRPRRFGKSTLNLSSNKAIIVSNLQQCLIFCKYASTNLLV